VQAVIWQIEQLRNVGYTGQVHVPVAGRGVLPADKLKAVTGLLDGRNDPDGALERGLDYEEQFSVLAALPNVDVDFTGLDDVTAVKARRESPQQDRCQPGDEERLDKRTGLDLWSAQRFTSALARRAGLGLVGENPGPPDSPFTGGSPSSDGIREQLGSAPSYAVECGMTLFLFGFEDDLFKDQQNGSPGATLEDYRNVIASVRNTSNKNKG
jgi:hypothetical protein